MLCRPDDDARGVLAGDPARHAAGGATVPSPPAPAPTLSAGEPEAAMPCGRKCTTQGKQRSNSQIRSTLWQKRNEKSRYDKKQRQRQGERRPAIAAAAGVLGGSVGVGVTVARDSRKPGGPPSSK